MNSAVGRCSADLGQLRVRIALASEVAERDDADHLLLVEHRQPPYLALAHELSRPINVVLRPHSGQVLATDLPEVGRGGIPVDGDRSDHDVPIGGMPRGRDSSTTTTAPM